MTGNALSAISPPVLNFFDGVVVHTASPQAVGTELLASAGNALAAAAWTTNRLVTIPFVVTNPLVVSQFFWINGATVNGNSDVGVYTEDGQTKLASAGSTANSGASVIQVVDITNVTLPANRRLWLVYGSDSGTHTVLCSDVPVGGQDLFGVKEQLSGWSSGLPTTLTFATSTVALTPIVGFTGASVI